MEVKLRPAQCDISFATPAQSRSVCPHAAESLVRKLTRKVR